jgi:hypothetical protein
MHVCLLHAHERAVACERACVRVSDRQLSMGPRGGHAAQRTAGRDATTFVGILDIFGFEVFETNRLYQARDLTCMHAGAPLREREREGGEVQCTQREEQGHACA